MGSCKDRFYKLGMLVFSCAALCSFTTLHSKDKIKDDCCKELAEDPQAWQCRPIPLGVSGGPIFGNCSAGTLGALVKNRCGKFILSNTHVLAQYDGAAPGDPILQPGTLDTACGYSEEDFVAHLANWVPLVPFGTSVVDAAIAKVIPNKVNREGAIRGIGVISRYPLEASVGLEVKKSGRASGVTSGIITAINASVVIEYNDFLTQFNDQIVVVGENISTAGDSGALFVEDIAEHPRPVGLLIAGSPPLIAIANPIQSVLDQLHVKFVGAKKHKKKSPGTVAKWPKEAFKANLAEAIEVQRRHSEEVMQIPGVVGHGIGISKADPSQLSLVVLVEGNDDASEVPTHVGTMPVDVLVVGKLKAL